MDKSKNCLILIGIVVVFAAVGSVEAAEVEQPGSLSNKHDALSKRLFTKEGEALEPRQTLRLLKELMPILVRLPTTERRIGEIENTKALIRLGELKGSQCHQETIDWYELVVDYQNKLAGNINILRYIKYYLPYLKKRCKTIAKQQRKAAAYADDESESDDF